MDENAAATAATNYGDNRRAAALAVHFGRGDGPGINVVLAETAALNRITPLYLAVLDLHEVVIPKLLTDDGLVCLTELVYKLADDPSADPDCRRAARMIIAHSGRDVPAFNTVIDEVTESHRASELLVGMLTVFATFVPQLYGEAGLSVLERSVLHWVAQEDSTT